jgi:hypothetical protein
VAIVFKISSKRETVEGDVVSNENPFWGDWMQRFVYAVRHVAGRQNARIEVLPFLEDPRT